jgi:hypothetical protein
MTNAQRQRRFETYFTELARALARSLGLAYLGTIRQLPPPPLPGQQLEATRYYVNGLAPSGGGTRLVEFTPALYAALRQAEAWVETGRGPGPAANPAHPGARRTGGGPGAVRPSAKSGFKRRSPAI